MERSNGNAMGFLTRLRKDVRGNTLAIMAAILIPLCAFSGSAIDMARLYVVKVRLQQACDAGALAGRRAMVDTDPSTPLDSTATAAAQTFFANNFHSGWFQNKNVLFTPSKTSDSQVAGTATTTVPMTVMSMFGVTPKQLNVSCEARYDVADADIMFVLDTTGSMACLASETGGCNPSVTTYTRPDGTIGYNAVEESGSKLSGLRSAVLSFYDTLTANIDTQTHIRYGFVTYTSTVNAGYLLPTADLVNKWSYNSRIITGDTFVQTNSSTTVSASSSADCQTHYSRTPATTTAVDPTTGQNYTVYPFNSSGLASAVDPVWSTKNGKSTCTLNNDSIKPTWTYRQVPYDVSKFITGVSVDDPSKITAATSKWQGCLEERQTTASSSFDASNLPPDLDPDLAPVASENAQGYPDTNDTRWRPMWPDVVYYRGSSTSVSNSGSSTTPYGDYAPRSSDGATTTYTNMIPNPNPVWDQNIRSGYVSCGKPAQRLATMTRQQVSDYVNAVDFKPQGGTYHDTGMIWGTRLISPTGIFAADTTAWPGHQAPNRYIVFMTDGEMSPTATVYGMYGMETYDKRVTGSNYSSTNDLNYHNARFVAECQAAKNRNITVFVVGFGQTLNSQLTACASPGQAYYASDNASLTTAFKQIANQVAQLRISK